VHSNLLFACATISNTILWNVSGNQKFVIVESLYVYWTIVVFANHKVKLRGFFTMTDESWNWNWNLSASLNWLTTYCAINVLFSSEMFMVPTFAWRNNNYIACCIWLLAYPSDEPLMSSVTGIAEDLVLLMKLFLWLYESHRGSVGHSIHED